MSDFSAQQKAAKVTLWLLTEGPLTVAQVAARLYETPSGAWRLLNDLGGPGVLPLSNDGGWWYVDIKALADLRRIHDMTGAELAETPAGMLYTRPFKREDVAKIHRLTGELLHVTMPTGQTDARILEKESAQQTG